MSLTKYNWTEPERSRWKPSAFENIARMLVKSIESKYNCEICDW